MKCYVMLKPGFATKELIETLRNELQKLNLTIVLSGYKKYSETEAKYHYIDKGAKPFYHELIAYLTSDLVYGFVLEGNDAINITRKLVEQLRITLVSDFNLKADKMRNVLHCTNYVNVDGNNLDLDSNREIELFKNNLK